MDTDRKNDAVKRRSVTIKSLMNCTAFICGAIQKINTRFIDK